MKDSMIFTTSPFKGVCQQCKHRTIVRNYPYNHFERLGTLCNTCFKEIDTALSSYEDYHEEEE